MTKERKIKKEPPNELAKRFIYVCKQWQKDKPAGKSYLLNMAEELGVHYNTLLNACKGIVGLTIFEAVENKLGYSHDWLVNGIKPIKSNQAGKKQSEIAAEKKQGYLDLVILSEQVTKLRQDIYAKDSRLNQLEKDRDYMMRILKEAGLI